jgi:hypothetical protein
MPDSSKVDHIVDEFKRHLPGHGRHQHEKLDVGRAFVSASLQAGLVGVPYNITLSGHTNEAIAKGVHFASRIFQMEDELNQPDKSIESVHAHVESSKIALPARSMPSSVSCTMLIASFIASTSQVFIGLLVSVVKWYKA